MSSDAALSRPIRWLRISVFASAALLMAAIVGVSQTPAPPASSALRVHGVGIRDLTLTRDDLEKMPHRDVKYKEHDGHEEVFRGVVVFDILKRAGFEFGQNLRGPRMADYLLAESAD